MSTKDESGKTVASAPVEASIDLSATEKILVVEAVSHSATKIQLKVNKFLRDKDPLVPTGSVIVIENRGDGIKYTVDGEEADPDQAELLSIFLHVSSPKVHVSCDSLLEPSEPKKVGESWKPDSKGLAEYYKTPDFEIGADGVSGTFKLVDVNEGPRGPILRVDSKLEMTKLHSGWIGDHSMINGSIKVEQTSTIAQDVKDLNATCHKEQTFTANMKGKVADDRIVEYQITIKQKADMTMAPVPTAK